MPENRKSGAKKYLILFGLWLLCVVGAYGYGRWQGAQTAAGIQAQAADYRQSVSANTAQAQNELGDLRARVKLLEARRRLDLALMALDERNFGTARDYLHAAGSDLAAVQSPPAGADAAVISRLAQELQSARLMVAEDFSQQRRRILGWIRELDAQFPTEPAPTVDASPVEDGSAPGTAAPPTAPGSETPAAPTGPR